MKNSIFYIYRMLNENNDILYIGKSKNLKQRINTHNKNIKSWMDKVNKIEYCELETEYEMNILEIHYICKYKPKYNKQYKSNDSELYNLPEYKWKIYDAHDFWKKPIYAIDVFIPLLNECIKTMSGKKITKGKLIALDNKLNPLKDKARAELWNSPIVQQLIDDKTIRINGRIVEFL